MSQNKRFKTTFAENIFRLRYAQGPNDTWDALARRLVEDVCGTRWGTEPMSLMSKEEMDQLTIFIQEMKFIPGGRYLYYAGRPKHFYNNCFLLKAEEDTREEWASLSQRAVLSLMSGGGIGVDYSVLRPKGYLLRSTGGTASGPIPLMHLINEVGRNVMQGGNRRSAVYASLNWQHEDIGDFLKAKDWSEEIRKMKQENFDFPAPLDMTNISINWDTDFILGTEDGEVPDLWYQSVERMMKTGEPGHSYNFFEKENETLRNACTEITSEDDSDVCNLGSINFANVENLDELKDVVSLGVKFLVNGTLRGDLPYEKMNQVRQKNRRLGLGIMGIHEWLLKRGKQYEVDDELREWFKVWSEVSEQSAQNHCDRFYLSHPVAYRAIAPTGTIGIMASSTTGIEPLFAVAYKRRYLADGTRWKYEYVIDATADRLIKEYGLDPSQIETSYSLASDIEKRIRFQYEVQKYVDHGISSTINLPPWGTEFNNKNRVKEVGDILLKYFGGLRGLTMYPDGGRSGSQPLTAVPYEEALNKRGVVYDEVEEKCKDGICGI